MPFSLPLERKVSVIAALFKIIHHIRDRKLSLSGQNELVSRYVLQMHVADQVKEKKPAKAKKLSRDRFAYRDRRDRQASMYPWAAAGSSASAAMRSRGSVPEKRQMTQLPSSK